MFAAILLLAIFFAVVATGVQSGLWSNVIRFVNVVFAGLLATSWYPNLAATLEGMQVSFGYVWDFVAVWALFTFFITVFSLLTGIVSRNRVRFKFPVDIGGGIFFACLTGWVMVCFSAMTLHMAPLQPTFLGGFQATPQSKVLGIGPDRLWLAFVDSASQGAFAGVLTQRSFDPDGDFILRYGARRRQFAGFRQLRYLPEPHLNAVPTLQPGMTPAEVAKQGFAVDVDEGESVDERQWVYGPYANGDGRLFKIRLEFQDGKLKDAYVLWQLQSDVYVKDQASAIGRSRD